MKGLDQLPALLAAGDWTSSERLLLRAAKGKGAPASVFYNLGRVMMEQGKMRPAETWLKRAVAADPSHANGWYELGRARLEMRDLQAACQCFARSLALAPADPDARISLGRVALRLGEYVKVREALAPMAWRDGEVDGMLYRAAAELRLPEAEALRDTLWQRDPARALKAVTRASKGRLKLDL
ncbi:tetratricopeptide repeat protein [Pseudooceanicola algae]|uniref:Uncharacterized protein n=1 Tax=Pseudooceanicola algae TaxID=1537215 RepID=A0A418SIA6_9RHOB|nr:tetratricopeptide repeat protein [Pseudooceanicola algae]QPM90221.1 hypothetical protein PSAL_014560 [Pseudooceanicola algae]